MNINFTNSKITCFVFTFPYSFKINTFLLHVFVHNTLLHIQLSIVNFVPCRYDTLTYFLYYLRVLNTLAGGVTERCVKDLTSTRDKVSIVYEWMQISPYKLVL